MPSEAQSLAIFIERLEAVEQQNRQLRKLCLALVAATIILTVALWFLPHRVLKSRKFFVEDANGRTVATLTSDGLAFLSKSNEKAAFLGNVTDLGVVLVLSDPTTHERFYATGSGIILTDEHGQISWSSRK